MAYYGKYLAHTWTASGDQSGNQWCFMTAASGNNSGYVARAQGSYAPYPLGVLQNDPADGEEAEVAFFGISKLVVSNSAAISYGDFLVCGSTGQGEYLAAACGVNAVALESKAAGVSAIISAFVLPPGTRMAADQVFP